MLDKIRQLLFTEPAEPTPSRLVPGIVIVALQWTLWLVVPAIWGFDALVIGLMGSLACGMAFFTWWAFFSRAPAIERFGALLLIVVSTVVVLQVRHESMAAAQLGFTFYFYAVPILCLAFVAWAVAARRLAALPRRVTMAAVIVISCGAWAFVRDEGMTSDIGHDFAWRWAETSDDRLAASTDEKPLTPPAEATVAKPGADWPGFRGPARDGVVRGLKIETDWSASPPREIWRRPIGLGFSSFAIRGELCYTQERRGKDEVVTCYHLKDGKPAWIHRDRARFLGADAHPGPRATPTVDGGRVYAFGATGILNALDARDGTRIWSRTTPSDIDARLPTWGLASSPLVAGSVVAVDVAGTLVAYDCASGEKRWSVPSGSGYGSPHLLSIDGIEQVVMLSGTGAVSYEPVDGKTLWEHTWPQEDRILQPALLPEGGILVGAILKGIRSIAVSRGTDGWTVEQRWTSKRMKSNFNDLVVHEGHAYGYSNTRLECIALADGTRKWRSGKYGGQIALLPDQGLLLVMSEKGELALVEAKPEKFTGLAILKVLEGKTWNHPAFAGDVLLVRNSREMAAYRLPVAGATSTAAHN